MNLDELAIKYGTDKSSRCHGYTEHYETHFGHLRGEVFNMLEIGIGECGSLNMWRDYFEKANVYAADNSMECLDKSRRIHGFTAEHTLHLDQRTKESLHGFKESLQSEMFLIIIDDATHDPVDQEMTMLALWPLLRHGGWYVIEDIMEQYCVDSYSMVVRASRLLQEFASWPKQPQTISEAHLSRNLMILRKA